MIKIYALAVVIVFMPARLAHLNILKKVPLVHAEKWINVLSVPVDLRQITHPKNWKNMAATV